MMRRRFPLDPRRALRQSPALQQSRTCRATRTRRPEVTQQPPATSRQPGHDGPRRAASTGHGRRAGLALALALAPLLAACHPHPQARSDDQRTAEGRILPHSTSDAMLPYDTASSQPPLAPHVDHALAEPDAPSDAATDADTSAPVPAPAQ